MLSYLLLNSTEVDIPVHILNDDTGKHNTFNNNTLQGSQHSIQSHSTLHETQRAQYTLHNKIFSRKRSNKNLLQLTGHVAGGLQKQLLLLALERHVPAGIFLSLPARICLQLSVQAAAI